ncbi:MAG: efflux RND transporter periplasmic adaptor subunit [Limnobacter sp.]|nr:efflux RND transporter periplasmic adaptor subunit [Limnobacter sp.]
MNTSVALFAKKPFSLFAHAMVPMALVASLVTLSGCGPKEPQAAPAEANYRLVQVSEVKSGPSTESVTASGVGAFRDESRLSFKVGGVVKTILVREGEQVKKGQLLASLDQQDVNAALTQAQAGFEKAQRDLERGKSLRAQEVIPQVQVENLETAAKVAQATLSQAQFASATASIKAPADGVVLKRFSQPSEVVAPGQPILLIGSESSGFVLKAALSDKQAVRVALGNEAKVQFDAHPSTEWTGKVIERSQASDPITGTYGIQVAIDMASVADKKLLSGMQGNLSIRPQGSAEDRSYVPLSAVVEGNNKEAWLFTVDANNVAKRTPVKVAFVKQDQLALLEPLPQGTKVVSSGAAYLRDGETVRIVGN